MRRFESMTGPAATLTAEDRSYLRGQAGSAGSGLLGGWSQSAFGGWFEEGPAVDEVRAELRRLSREAVPLDRDLSQGSSRGCRGRVRAPRR